MNKIFDSIQGPKKPENPRKPITPILSSNITDNRSPFYGRNSQNETRKRHLISYILGSQPPPFAKIIIRRVMTQGVACPSGRPQHGVTPAPIDFGPNFVDLSRTTEVESEKEVTKPNVELLGNIFYRSFLNKDRSSQMINHLILDV